MATGSGRARRDADHHAAPARHEDVAALDASRDGKRVGPRGGGGEARMQSIQRGHQARLASTHRGGHRPDDHTWPDPRRRVADEEEVRQGIGVHAVDERSRHLIGSEQLQPPVQRRGSVRQREPRQRSPPGLVHGDLGQEVLDVEHLGSASA